MGHPIDKIDNSPIIAVNINQKRNAGMWNFLLLLKTKYPLESETTL